MVSAQVSSSDRKLFADKINQRRAVYNLGVNPYSQDNISVVFEGIKYSGVKAVSNKLMINAYPAYNPLLVVHLFETLGLDEAVFDKFVFQVCLLNLGNKNQIIRSLEIFCNNENLSQRIYDKYWKKYGEQVKSNVAENKLIKAQQDQNKPKSTTTKRKSIFDSNNIKEENTESNTEEPKQKLIQSDTEKIDEIAYMPIFLNGNLGSFISTNLKYPDSAFKNNISGKVEVEFIVDTLGKAKNVHTIGNEYGYGLEQEAIRIIELTNWIPAKKNDNKTPVNSTQHLNINFSLSEE